VAGSQILAFPIDFDRRLTILRVYGIIRKNGQTDTQTVEVFHHESWKPTYFRVKRSNVTVTRHNSLPA